MRQKEADSFLRELPNLMSGMFDYLEGKVEGQERDFKDEISEIVRRQQVAIKKDIQNKVPSFTQRLSQKYS